MKPLSLPWAGGLLLGTALLCGATPAWGQERLPAQVEMLPSEAGTVRMVVSVDDLPPGASLDPSSVRVTTGGEQWPAQASAVGGVAEQRTSILVVDTSGSMGAQGIAAAQAAGNRYLDGMPKDVAVGLVTFSQEARVVVPPTQDRVAVRSALAGMRPGGNTALYDGILVALSALGTQGERSVVVLSDGADTSSTATIDAAGNGLKKAGASVDLVSFGTAGGQRAALDQLAAMSAGRVMQADDAAQLSQVFAVAARTIVDEITVTVQVPPAVDAERAELVVQVDAGAVTAGSTADVALPAPPVDTSGTAAAAPSVVSTTVPWLLPVTVAAAFLALFALFSVALGPLGRDGQSRKRVRDVERFTLSRGSVSATVEAAPAAITQTALEWAGRTVQRRGVEDSWRLELDRAAIPLRPHEWFIVRLGVALVGVALAVLLFPWWLLTGPLTGLGFWLLAGAYVRIKAGRRLKRFAENLPDVLQLIAGSLKSGFSLPQAVDNAAKDGEQPMAGELSRALAESRLGVDLEDALDRVAERMKSTDLEWTVMAVRIAREVGGNLAEVLLSTAETMRERARIQRQVRVLSAEGRLSAYVLLGLPAGITLFMVMFRGSYIAPLITDPIGWIMTGYGVISIAIGAFVMSRLCKLEV